MRCYYAMIRFRQTQLGTIVLPIVVPANQFRLALVFLKIGNTIPRYIIFLIELIRPIDRFNNPVCSTQNSLYFPSFDRTNIPYQLHSMSSQVYFGSLSYSEISANDLQEVGPGQDMTFGVPGENVRWPRVLFLSL